MTIIYRNAVMVLGSELNVFIVSISRISRPPTYIRFRSYLVAGTMCAKSL